MPPAPSVPAPSFGLSRWEAPVGDEWDAYFARIDPSVRAASAMTAEVEASILAAEAVILGRPARRPSGG